MLDCGLDTCQEGNTLARELPAHEIGHSVESANNGVHGSPAYEIWGDSKWAEFYIHNLYTALGMDREAKGVYTPVHRQHRRFPSAGEPMVPQLVHPPWREPRGQAEVMNRFFRELARQFPRDSGGTYTRRMNWGEYVHFTSGAAAADLSGLAARAFGWPREWADQLEHAHPDGECYRIGRPRAYRCLRWLRATPPALADVLLAGANAPKPMRVRFGFGEVVGCAGSHARERRLRRGVR